MSVVRSILRGAFLGLLVVVLSSCGGGTGGTGSPVVASGVVMGLGSVVVNGIVFDTASATITRDGQRGSVADLRLGQVVTVRGVLHPDGTTGSAETVLVDIQAIGPIDSIDHGANFLVVLGQSVRLDAMTYFGATPLSTLAVGNIVAVSGFADADGILRATRLDRTQEAFIPGTEFEIDGIVTNLDTTQQRFTLNMLQVDFSTALLLHLPMDQLSHGQVVTVKSQRDIAPGVLFADSVAGKEVRVQGAPGERVELQGIITRVIMPNTFEINGQPVRLTSGTVFAHGTAADLAPNVRLEVEGFFDVDGTVVVEEVEFGAGIERRGLITQVTATDTFEVDDRPVRLTPATVFEGGTRTDLALNVRVKVEGFFATDGVLVATEVDFFVEFEGLITRLTALSPFEVNDQPVRLTPGTVFEGGTAADLALNVRVEVKGFFAADGVLVATEIEFLP